MIHKIGLIDYGMGNLHSVQLAFNRLDSSIVTVDSPSDLKDCQALVLPGVGSFDPAMQNLKETGLIPYLNDWFHSDKPLLGICLGLQLLFSTSDEGALPGLGYFQGHVRKLPDNQGERIPHMGWAKLKTINSNPLLDKTEEKNWMYFVHSYSAVPTHKSDLAASVEFGGLDITAIVWKRRFGACQFHPEKSSNSGNLLLSRWINWLKDGATI